MLSYRHGFHAGNMADVHKHWILCLLLAHLRQKDKPFCVIDTHAGDGLYDLANADAAKNREYESGIGRLWQADVLPTSLLQYRDRVAAINPNGRLQYYPGSPVLIRQALRDDDMALLLEAHPAASDRLRRELAERGRISVQQRDAFEGLPGMVPPRIRRGLVLVDPSYEVKTDYHAIPALVKTAIGKWSQAIYAIWYPLLPEARHQHLCRQLAAIGVETVRSELRLHHVDRGMSGSGMMVLNPPWQFHQQLQADGPVLAGLLSASWYCE